MLGLFQRKRVGGGARTDWPPGHGGKGAYPWWVCPKAEKAALPVKCGTCLAEWCSGQGLLCMPLCTGQSLVSRPAGCAWRSCCEGMAGRPATTPGLLHAGWDSSHAPYQARCMRDA
jgi:hypothetical protein